MSISLKRFLSAFALAVALGIPHVASAASSLADAVEKSDRAAIRELLKNRADVNVAQADGMTALHWAVYKDDLETAKQLLAAGANVKAENRYQVTPLSLACLGGNSALVDLLLDAGADPNSALNGGETVLMTAARTGKPGPVKSLIAKGADVNAKERRGQTAVMWAAADGHAEVVEVLIAAGADFRTPLDSGFTPMFFAVREGRTSVVKTLLKAGVDVNEAIQPRVSNAKGPRKGTAPLALAVENGHLDLAAALLEAGADPNDQRSGFTALHILTWVRKPNRGDGDDGDPSPIGSGSMSSLQLVRKLVEHGADVNTRLKGGKSGKGQLNRTGATAFLLASFTADLPFLKLLVELGADPNLPNADNATPLMAAAGLGSMAPGEEAGLEPEALEVVAYLLKLGANINVVDANGETAMHGAAYKSFPLMVKFLSEHGAKVDLWNRTNKYGWTPLRIAQGYRVGNFKPAPETISALESVMRNAGIAVPRDTGPAAGELSGDYSQPAAKKKAAQQTSP